MQTTRRALHLCGSVAISGTKDQTTNIRTKVAPIALTAQEMPRVWGAVRQKPWAKTRCMFLIINHGSASSISAPSPATDSECDHGTWAFWDGGAALRGNCASVRPGTPAVWATEAHRRSPAGTVSCVFIYNISIVPGIWQMLSMCVLSGCGGLEAFMIEVPWSQALKD